jgi:O-antigen ligase
MSSTLASTRSFSPALAEARRAPLVTRAWGAYALLAVALAPVLLPAGPGQSALVDVLNVVALIAFAFVALAHRVPVRLPFVLAILVISAGSLVATVNAAAPGKALLTMAQDLYLYLWFVMLIEVLRRRSDLKGTRLAWVVVANVLSVICVLQAIQDPLAHFPRNLLAPEGNRMYGTLYNPNMCADYLVLSVFVILSLWRQAPRLLLVPSLGLVLFAFLTTKSNGGLVSLAAGLAVWAILRVRDRGRAPLVRYAGIAVAAGGIALMAWWGLGVSGMSGGMGELGKESFLARMSKSGADRGAIWQRLEESYRRTPLGIGPGNSTAQPVDVAHQQRRGSFYSKEPHSDYVGYAIERGPVALVALLWLTVAVVLFVLRGRGRLDARLGDPVLGGLVTAAVVGGLVASSVHSLVIEKLHFRHFWAFFALAVALASTNAAEDAASARPAAARRAS